MAYAQVEPFGMLMQNLQVGRVISFLANVFSKKGTQQFSASDFTIGFDQEKSKPNKQTETQIADSLKNAFKGMAEQKDKKKKRKKR